MRVVAVAIVALALAVPASAAPASAIVFGRHGGNIRPFTVTIAASGKVTVRGAIRTGFPPAKLSAAALRGLHRLATAERFSALPASVRCPRVLPDIGADFVTIGGHTVSVMGSCQPGFDELFAVLMAAAGVAP